MLFPRSYAWTLRQRWLIAAGILVGIVFFSALVYCYERYYRGPDDSFFVGTWRGEASYTIGPPYIGYRFNANHTYEGEWEPSGWWYAGGDFLYLRQRLDDSSGPYDRLQIWHIDSMSSNEVHIHYGSLRAVLKRIE
jgi:hypothetical protein